MNNRTVNPISGEALPAPRVDIQSIVDYKELVLLPLFSKIDRRALLSMLPEMRREHWPRGYGFKDPEQTKDRFYLLLKGRVKIGRHHLDSGRELTLFLLGPGDAFNALNLIDGGVGNMEIYTLDEVEVLSVPTERWLVWMAQYPPLHKAIAELAASQIGRLSDLASELALDDTMTRLLHLISRYFNNSSHGLNLIHNLPQEELAHMIGTVRPVVARLLGELKRDGVINTDGGEIHVRNLQRLLEKADDHLGNLPK